MIEPQQILRKIALFSSQQKRIKNDVIQITIILRLKV